MAAAEWVFWGCAAAAVYVYVGYPLVLVVLAAIVRRPDTRRASEPSVSLLVAAHNEAGMIEAKVRNALDLDYPAGQLEIVIASDGSRDGTADLARRAAAGDPRVRVFDYPANRGKVVALNDSIPQLRGDIVAFSDASSMLAPDSLRQLVTHFADPQVGAASGVYKVLNKENAQLGAQEGFYWKYETFLKVQEGRLGSILGAHGSLYAIRRALYPFPAPGTINDDYVIPFRILRQGYRVAYEPAAVAFEEAHEMGGFGRRVRIMAGNLQQTREIRELLWPPRYLTLFFFISHKVGRMVVPLCMLAMLIANATLLERPLYRFLGVVQLGFYAIALAGARVPLHPRMLRLPYYFCMINAAMFCAIYRWILPGRQIAWKH